MWYRLHCLYINGTLHKSGLNGLKHGHVVSRCLLHFNLDIKNPKNYSKIKIKKYAFEITGTKIGIKKNQAQTNKILFKKKFKIKMDQNQKKKKKNSNSKYLC